MSFIEQLQESGKKYRTLACVGFDPLTEKTDNPKEYFFDIIDMMHTRKLIPAAFKPNVGYFNSFGTFANPGKGLQDLNEIITALHTVFPDVPVILDSKRGDIARSSKNYADEAARVHRADAVTVSPYMGRDSLFPFAEETGLGVYVLNRTSNPGGADVQNIRLADGSFLYEAISRLIVTYNRELDGSASRFGAVVGATNLKEMADICAVFSGESVPLLIPGVGSQGAQVADVRSLLDRSGIEPSLVRINSSSKICFPYAVTRQNGIIKKPAHYMQQVEDSLQHFLTECRL